MTDFGNYRRDLAVLDIGGGRIPQIQQPPPTAIASQTQTTPWTPKNNGASVASPTTGYTTFYNDSSDNLSQNSQISPGVRPGNGATGSYESPAEVEFADERRPSVASTNTASSMGSRSSGRGAGIHKKLQTFFGEDYPGKEGSDTSLPSHGREHRSHSFARSHRERNLSSSTEQGLREGSPAPLNSRPRTPIPSSDVVPFLYQDSQVSKYQNCLALPRFLRAPQPILDGEDAFRR